MFINIVQCLSVRLQLREACKLARKRWRISEEKERQQLDCRLERRRFFECQLGTGETAGG